MLPLSKALSIEPMVKTIAINADVKDGLVVDEVIKAIKAKLDAAGIDKTVSYEFRGNTEEQQKSMVFLNQGIWCGVLHHGYYFGHPIQ